MAKRFPVKTSLITDLPEEKQEWLRNLKPPTRDSLKPIYVNKHKKPRKR